MKSVFGLIGVVCLCGLVVVGCRRTSLAGSSTSALSAARAAPSPPVARTAPDSEEQEVLPREVIDVAQAFVDALAEDDWATAAGFFCADFYKAHREELLDGTLLGRKYDIGKGVCRIFNNEKVTRATIRGDRAWAIAQTRGMGPLRQGHFSALELIREEGGWKLLRFPPAPYAYCAATAGHSGSSAGYWFKSMLSDGEFSPQEQAEIAEVLDRYYAIVVQMQSKIEERHLPSPDYHSATMQQLTEVYERLKARPELEIRSITFWPKPSEDVVCVGEALAEQAVRQIYEDLAAAKDKYPELAKFDEKHVTLTEGGLSYFPNPPIPHQKNGPTVMVYIDRPYLGVSQAMFPRRIFLPRQKLAVSRQPGSTDEPIHNFARQTIEKNIEPLIRVEKLLGGEPSYDEW